MMPRPAENGIRHERHAGRIPEPQEAEQPLAGRYRLHPRQLYGASAGETFTYRKSYAPQSCRKPGLGIEAGDT